MADDFTYEGEPVELEINGSGFLGGPKVIFPVCRRAIAGTAISDLGIFRAGGGVPCLARGLKVLQESAEPTEAGRRLLTELQALHDALAEAAPPLPEIEAEGLALG